jgi:hypothetical protein
LAGLAIKHSSKGERKKKAVIFNTNNLDAQRNEKI